jgi:hypothetical protein
MEGLWQSQAGAALPVGESRPGWKVLRVLGNLLNLSGFEYQSSEDVRDEVRKACGASVGVNGNAVSPLADIPVAPRVTKVPTRSCVARRPSGQRGNPQRGQGRASSTCPCTRSTRWCAGHLRCRRPAKAVRPRQRTDEIGRDRVRIEFSCSKVSPICGCRCRITAARRPGLLVITVVLILSVAFLTLWERKVIGWMQLRRGTEPGSHLRTLPLGWVSRLPTCSSCC